jgi:hypothetical protein
MDRRQLLGAVAGVGTTAVAGCTGFTGPTDLDDPRLKRDDGEVRFGFGEPGDEIARSTVMYSDPPNSGLVVPMRYLMWHREGTTVESLDLQIRSPPAGHEPPASVFLAIPQNADIPDVRLYSARDTKTRIVEIPDLGIMGEGTFGLDFYLEPTVETAPLPVHLGIESRVTEPGLTGQTYHLEGTATIEVPNE